jgi:hypothetical protein
VDHPNFAPRAFHLGDGGPDRRFVRSAIDKQLAQPPLSVEQMRALGPRFGEHRRQQRLRLDLLLGRELEPVLQFEYVGAALDRPAGRRRTPC